MANEATVTIPLEEYIELRRKADENLYLANQLGQMDQRMWNNEKRLIDANEAVELVLDFAGQAETKSAYAAFWKAGNAIKQMPTVDAVEVVHGRWIEHPNSYENYCGYCGAKKDGGDKDGV